MNTVNSDIFVGTSSLDSYTRAINEENIYPSILNRVCLNSPYTAECAPDMLSSLVLAPTLVTSSVSLEELTNSYSNSPISTPPIASDAVNFGTENISNANIFPQFLLSSTSARSCQTEVEEEPRCSQCDQICSSAHHCPGCYKAIHTICGHSAGQEKGFGSSVWCSECWVDARDVDLLEGRLAAKRGQERQISRMVKQSSKRFRTFEIGENVLLSIPNVDKCSPFDTPNLVGIILNRSDEGFYEIGTSARRLERRYICTQFDLSHSQTLSTIDVSSKTVTLREAALHVSLGKQRQFCKCTAGCNTNRCWCRRNKKICGSRCHKNLACHNRVT